MASEFDVQAVEGSDEDPFTADDIEQLAKVHLLACWPVLRSALLRYQARALSALVPAKASIDDIRVAQGRLEMARQLLQLLETDAPTLYDRKQKQDANADDDSSDD